MTNLIDPGSTTSSWTFIRINTPLRSSGYIDWDQYYLTLDNYKDWLHENCLLGIWQWQFNRISEIPAGIYIADPEVAMLFKLKFQL